MGKITRRVITTAATLAVAGGIVFTSGGAASAATAGETTARTAAVTAAVTVRHSAWHNTDTRRWDGRRLWIRAHAHGDWFSSDHGNHYRYDGHRFYRWSGGKWRVVSSDYARRHGFDRRDFRPAKHDDHGHDHDHDHGHDDHHGHGH
ncbi:hypothetical protein Misp01_15620 [Microtetraspora sp. NBRC 13810]|uniref:hypothetical protein n=1 Tax=Microtetraspora sp. NBRC 13810 TaxID=3030990 RepID=UPI0024A51A30|nr:hypothetical protein [Microtetraspora sp. NBRC 13810]GLW06432.1 hypothetical protein Misp01_15620 [Microtetraspora sp. NBRC 13810]